MSAISADVIGQIILTTLSKYPELFVGNYTLADVFAAVRYNGTILSVIANATGVDKQVIENSVDLYLAIVQYLRPTSATPPSNRSNTTR